MKPLADGFSANQLLAKGVPALVGFDDGVYLLDAFQVGCPPITPVACARDTQCRYLVEPERVAIALSLHQDYEASSTSLVEESKPIGMRLVAASPPELLGTVHGDAEADSSLLTFLVRIGYADGRLLQVGHVPQT